MVVMPSIIDAQNDSADFDVLPTTTRDVAIGGVTVLRVNSSTLRWSLYDDFCDDDDDIIARIGNVSSRSTALTNVMASDQFLHSLTMIP